MEVAADEEGTWRVPRATGATRVAKGDRSDRVGQMAVAGYGTETWRVPRATDTTRGAEGDWSVQVDLPAAGEDWAEAVEEEEEGKGERQEEEGGGEAWEGPTRRKRKLQRAPKRVAPSCGTEPSDSSLDTEASREGMEEVVGSRRRGKPLRTRGRMKLRELADESCYRVRVGRSESD
ncbi:unnamed protein product [Lampetra fluviatilis]